MTLDRMQARTGLSRSTIHQALQRLAHPDVDIVNVVHPGGGNAPVCTSSDHALSKLARQQAKPLRTRRRPKLLDASDVRSIENLLAHLSEEDRADLQIVYESLQASEREIS